MKKLLYLSSILFLFANCSDNTMNSILVDGATFVRTNYVLEVPVDVNGDGVFSNDVLTELDCGADYMIFQPGETVSNPTFHGFGLQVDDDGNGNLSQSMSCGIGDGLLPSYRQVDFEVFLMYGDEIELTGELSNDGTKIEFRVPRSKLIGLSLSGGDILNQNGTVTNYDGDAIITYTRQ